MITVEAFRELLSTTSPEAIINDHLLGGPTYLFLEDPAEEASFKGQTAERLGIPPDAIHLVGSAKLGFSVDPAKFPRAFSPSSDIDLLVIDESLFDQLWSAILRWHQPIRNRAGSGASDWARKRRREIYWGCFDDPAQLGRARLTAATALRPLRALSFRWFEAFRSLSVAIAGGRSIGARLYRTRDHAILYQRGGLAELRDRVSRESGVER